MASYQHEWQCIYCGKTIRRISSQENPPTPFFPGKCNGNPSGDKNAKHVVIKIK